VLETQEVKRHFEEIAEQYDYWKDKNKYYYEEIKRFLRSQIPPAKKVLDVGCGTGSLLAALEPSRGVGVDLSERMVQIAQRKFPELTYLVGECERLQLSETFDYVILVDLLDHISDLHSSFSSLKRMMTKDSKLVLLTANPKWDSVLKWAEKWQMKMPEGPNRFVPIQEAVDVFEDLNFRILERGFRLFLPKKIPFISSFFNAWVPKTPILKEFCLIQYLIVSC